MSEEIQRTLFRSYGTNAEVLHFDRQMDDHSNRILLERLQTAREQKTVFITTNSSIQSLFLNLFEHMGQYRTLADTGIATHELEHVVRGDQRVLAFLKRHAVVIIDEIDTIMDILKAHYFAVGEKGNPHPDTLLAVSGLYQMLAVQEDIPVRCPF